METKKKQFKMPHTFVIIGIIILFAVLLTWIIPAGSYTRFENEAGLPVSASYCAAVDSTMASKIACLPGKWL